MDLGIKALQHIGIPTTDIGDSESFYVSLGFEKVMHAGFDHPEGTGTCIIMQLHTILIEIYQFPGAASAPVFLQFWDKGCRYFNIIGPNNERLEFNQRL